MSENIKKKTPCKKGTRRNKKTGECEPIKNTIGVEISATEKKAPCKKGTRRNKKTGECEPILKMAPAPVPVPASVPASNIIAPEQGRDTEEASLPETEVAPEPLPVPVPITIPAPEPDIKGQNKSKNDQELLEREDIIKNNNDYDFLYPNLNDPEFNIKISKRKEFNDNRYDGDIYPDIEKQSEILCNADFELVPHQLFVRNFLSFQTPYNSLLLYHGLGSGKTCSAIGVAEEMRDYIMQMGLISQILIVASPNVQINFKLQLFDERKLKSVDGLWNIQSCVGNKLLKEINPMNMKGLSRENIVKQINKIIDMYYMFFGYVEFANYIKKISTIDDPEITDPKRLNTIRTNKLRKIFNNSLIIIDEVQNIRITDDNKDKRVAEELIKLIKHVSTLRLLLLSATPMFNSYKEIIWLINLMNMNDRRSKIETKDVFNSDGSFKVSSTGEEIGRELLERKATGYISFVRGENPYTFPYRLWPKEFSPENTFPNKPYPTMQLNGTLPILQNIEHLSLFLIDIGEYQQRGYNYIIKRLKGGHIGNYRQMPNLENIEHFGYTMLQQPLEGLNIIYPDERLDLENPEFNSQEIIGNEGLKQIMNFTENENTHFRSNFTYKPATIQKYGRIFSSNEIGKYSNKIKTICDRIINSTGVVLVYSQYIDAGLVPLALALEEVGLLRAGDVNSLFAEPPPVEKRTGMKYVMITGDKGFSPNPANDIKMVTDDANKDGSNVKVVLISQTGAEGLDLKFIRQVHILEPWYNMNRVEQIIGRAVRTCSHKALPFAKRNVEIYLYGSLMRDNVNEETVDMYMYRLAEVKAIQIGKVSRVLKEISIDCILNKGQMNFTEENMENNNVKPVTLELGSGKKLENYKVGDKPFSSLCDYMETCSYTCRPDKEITNDDIQLDTYNENYIMMNTDKLVYKIKQLFKERFFYKKKDIVIMLNAVKTYPLVQINAALYQLVDDKNEYITDKYGRLGHLINIDDLYLFQPIELKNNRISVYDRSVPLDVKHEKVLIKLPKQNKVQEAVIDIKEVKEKNEIEVLTNNIITNYKLALTEQKLGNGEKNWYKFCNLAIAFLKKSGFSEQQLFDLVIEHIVDELSLTEVLLLLNNVTNLTGTENENADIFNRVNLYLNKQIIIGKNGIKGFLSKQNVIVKQKDEPWHLAESEDIKDLDYVMNELKNNIITNLNTIMGFMINFKNENYVVFKTKDISNPRDLGARCDQNSNKGKAITILNSIVGSNMYSTNLEIPQREICIIQEFYLRIFDKSKKNNKRWFLTPAESVLTNIEKYSTVAKKNKTIIKK